MALVIILVVLSLALALQVIAMPTAKENESEPAEDPRSETVGPPLGELDPKIVSSPSPWRVRDSPPEIRGLAANRSPYTRTRVHP